MPRASFRNLAQPWNWILQGDILAKIRTGTKKNVMGTGPSSSRVRARLALGGQENPDYWDKASPSRRLRAIFITSASAQVAASARARHDQFRSFTPADRDTLVNALGSKITVQRAPELLPSA